MDSVLEIIPTLSLSITLQQSKIWSSRNGNEHEKQYRENWLYARDFDRRGTVMGRQSLNIVGDTAWLFVVVLRDLLRARRWALVNDCFTPQSVYPAIPTGA